MDALVSLLDLEPISSWMRGVFTVELARLTIAFVFAERLHARAMKKNMAEQFSLLRGTIDHAIGVFGTRLDGLEDRLEVLEKK
jgi:hypothetical protein